MNFDLKSFFQIFDFIYFLYAIIKRSLKAKWNFLLLVLTSILLSWICDLYDLGLGCPLTTISKNSILSSWVKETKIKFHLLEQMNIRFCQDQVTLISWQFVLPHAEHWLQKYSISLQIEFRGSGKLFFLSHQFKKLHNGQDKMEAILAAIIYGRRTHIGDASDAIKKNN